MEPLSFDATITKKDYRRAVYFNTFEKNKIRLFVLSGVFILSVLCIFIKLLGLFALPDLVFFSCVCFVALLIMQAVVTENIVRKFVKSDTTSIGCETQAEVDNEHIALTTASGSYSTFKWPSVIHGFELKEHFLFFINTQQVIILPKRGMSSDDMAKLRALSQKKLGLRWDMRCK